MRRNGQIDLPASTPWVSHSVGEDDVAPKPLEHLIYLLHEVVQRSTRWAIYRYQQLFMCVHWNSEHLHVHHTQLWSNAASTEPRSTEDRHWTRHRNWRWMGGRCSRWISTSAWSSLCKPAQDRVCHNLRCSVCSQWHGSTRLSAGFTCHPQSLRTELWELSSYSIWLQVWSPV
jgi:hypothetical protein